MASDEVLASSHRQTLRAFLPLSEDVAISTRGQTLPALLHSLSTPPRRISTFRLSDQLDDVESQRDSGEHERRKSWDAHSAEERRPGLDERRLSNAAFVLMTPQMRSQRLIGNSNPRYRW
jgi:hypothetical protein